MCPFCCCAYGQVVPLQVPEMQGVPCVQQGSPEPPQSVHSCVPPTVAHTVLVSVQTAPGQHGEPSVPHDSQKPYDEQTWLLVGVPQEAPCATQVLVAVV
jgi:hypothetical protein